MTPEQAGVPRKRCRGCQFEAPAGAETWESTAHPSLGTLTQCPECGSTDIQNVE